MPATAGSRRRAEHFDGTELMRTKAIIKELLLFSGLGGAPGSAAPDSYRIDIGLQSNWGRRTRKLSQWNLRHASVGARTGRLFRKYKRPGHDFDGTVLRRNRDDYVDFAHPLERRSFRRPNTSLKEETNESH
jgi:hypothetical protein